jgi:membrane fusion protein, heavy metal efflux system
MSFSYKLTPFILAAALSAGCASVHSDPSDASSPAPIASGFFKPTDQQWQGLSITPAQRRAFPNVDETDGSIVSADDATTQVFSPYTGRITKVFVAVGDVVAKGRPLFAIAGSEFAQAQNDLAAAVQTRDAAGIQLKATQANRTRLLKLSTLDAVTGKDVEQSAVDLANAQAALRNDETALALVRSRLRVLGESDTTIDDLEKAAPGHILPTDIVVPTPIAGVITQRAAGAGQYVQSAASGGANALFTIADFSRVFFAAAVRETNVVGVRLGAPVEMTLQAFPRRVFHARVRYIAPSVDPTTHRIVVRSEIGNPDGLLKPGMFGSSRIFTGASATEIAVPEEAVVFEGDDARVWIVGPNKTLALRPIRAGKTLDGMVEVLAGLRSGDRVVTRGSVFIDRAAQGGD